MTPLSSGLEDYIEVIYNALRDKETVKAVEISKIMNVSRASVSEAISRLEEKKLIINEGHGGIRITPEGIKEAENVTYRHNVLKKFFSDILYLDEEEAVKNACRAEHVISEDSFERIKKLQQFCEADERFMNDFRRYAESNE